VKALNSGVAGFVADLKRALEAGLPAYPDSNRSDFYDIELARRWAYIHVQKQSRTIYLVALSSTE
jgi:hypothetical protein